MLKATDCEETKVYRGEATVMRQS